MNNCMNKYKNDFTIKFARTMQEKLPKWKEFQTEERKSLYSLGSIMLYLGTSLLGFIPGKNEHNYDLKLHLWIVLGFFIFAIITNIQITNKNYQNKIKSTFFNDILKVFGKHINYARSRKIKNSVFNESKLYPRDIETREDDDCFHGEYNNVNFIMNETDFGYTVRTSKGSHYERMFKGVAMQFDLNKQIKSHVIIRSKGLLNNVPKNYEKVELEYNKFSSKYNVWVEKNGEGQIEARYLLNTAFIDRLMQIQTSFRVNKIACSVYDDNMLIMLSTGRDLFEMNHLLGKIDDIKQYKHLFEEFASVLSFIDVLNLSSTTKL